jgi:hypothetical protein
VFVVVTGSRHATDVQTIADVLTRTVAAFGPISTLYHGGAKGADTIARDWAAANGVRHVAVRANWDKFGKGAGMVRNREMLDLAKYSASLDDDPLLVLAFPVSGLECLGTWGCVREARARGIKVQVHELAR